MSIDVETNLIDTTRSISQNVLKRWAADVDTEGRFPAESLAALQESGLLGYFVPAKYGGLAGDFKTFSKIAAILGEGCLSTALIWAMHCQQVAVLAYHAAEEQADTLMAIATHGHLVASVTTEYGKGGDLLSAQAPIIWENSSIRICRSAPIVSYGVGANYYLITMRSGEEKLPNDVSLILLKSTDGHIKATGDWNAMGMRGTQSVPMEFDVLVDKNRIINQPFRRIALQTMVPAGHIGWTAAWLGAARGAVKRFIRQLRTTKGSSKLKSDLFILRLAKLRVSLDLIEALLYQTTEQVNQLNQDGIFPEQYEDITYNIAVNNLKVAGSQLTFEVIDGLMELSGLSQGYLKGNSLEIERVFRDLRSAALMYNNDRLLKTNGKLMLVEDSPMQTIWQKEGS